MYKVILLSACLTIALCKPKPELMTKKLVDEDKELGALLLKNYRDNPIAQKLYSLKENLPWLSVKTYGKRDKDNKLSTFTRGSFDFFGIKGFEEVITNDKAMTLGIGGGLGDLVNIYYSEDASTREDTFMWEFGI